MRAGYTYIDQQDGKFHLVTAAGARLPLAEAHRRQPAGGAQLGVRKVVRLGRGAGLIHEPEKQKARFADRAKCLILLGWLMGLEPIHMGNSGECRGCKHN